MRRLQKCPGSLDRRDNDEKIDTIGRIRFSPRACTCIWGVCPNPNNHGRYSGHSVGRTGRRSAGRKRGSQESGYQFLQSVGHRRGRQIRVSSVAAGALRSNGFETRFRDRHSGEFRAYSRSDYQSQSRHEGFAAGREDNHHRRSNHRHSQDRVELNSERTCRR